MKQMKTRVTVGGTVKAVPAYAAIEYLRFREARLPDLFS